MIQDDYIQGISTRSVDDLVKATTNKVCGSGMKATMLAVDSRHITEGLDDLVERAVVPIVWMAA